MKKTNERPSGSERMQNGPKAMKDVLNEYFSGGQPLAVASRQRLASDEISAEKGGMNNNTHLCVDVKTRLVSDKQMVPGKTYRGTIKRDVVCEDYLYDEHFTFTENQVSTDGKRNPCAYKGLCVNVHQRADGSLYPTLRRPHFTADYTFGLFCREAAEELTAVAGLVEETEAEV